jgi:hypothetical protein
VEYVEAGLTNAGAGPDYEGIIYSDGHVSARWCGLVQSTSEWASFADFIAVHGHPEYETEIRFTPAGATRAVRLPPNLRQDIAQRVADLLGPGMGSMRLRPEAAAILRNCYPTGRFQWPLGSGPDYVLVVAQLIPELGGIDLGIEVNGIREWNGQLREVPVDAG